MMFSFVKLLDLSNRIYCLLLHLYPTPFRREYGYHMAQVFRDDVRGTLQEGGALAVLGLWLLAFFDLLKTTVAEHIQRQSRGRVGFAGFVGLIVATMYVSDDK